MKSKTRDATLHLRVDPAFKRQIEEAAQSLDIPPASWMRMALRDYIARHKPETLREQSPGYTAGLAPDKKLRCAIADATARTSYYVVTRKG